MESSVQYVMYAGMVVWTTLGLYLFSLARKQRTIHQRLQQLATLLKDNE